MGYTASLIAQRADCWYAKGESSHECVQLTCRLFSSISSLLTGADSPRAILNTDILFVFDYGSMLLEGGTV
jgi:hypothetical protein